MQITRDEYNFLRSRFVTLETGRGKYAKYLPYALSHKDLTAKLKELESKYDKQFNDVYDAINFLLQKDNLVTAQIQRKRIGYKNR